MDSSRRARIEECRDEIDQWVRELRIRCATDRRSHDASGAPGRIIAAYERALEHLDEEGLHIPFFDQYPPWKLSFVEAPSVIQVIDFILEKHSPAPSENTRSPEITAPRPAPLH